jgi:hypothetical protein
MESLAEIIKSKKKPTKAPSYPWQDLALQVIAKLNVPGFKRSSVFKVCRDHSPKEVKLALNDTKELCAHGAKWNYFFKIIDQKK